MEKNNDTKERIIQTAARLFQQQGYNATGLNQIVKESSAPKGSLYYYFPNGKEELGVAAVRLIQDNIEYRIRSYLAKEKNAVQAVQALIRATAQAVIRMEWINFCTVSLIALETNQKSEPLREACHAANAAWARAFADKLLDSGFVKEQAEELGILIQIIVDGALINSLSLNDTRPLHIAAERIPALLQSGMQKN